MTRDIRAQIDVPVVSQILEGCIGHAPAEVKRIASGQISSTFECIGTGASHIVQFTEPGMATGLDIERRFGQRLSQAGVPLREVVCDGVHDGLRWTVTRKVVGEGMTALSGEAYEESLPSVFDTLLSLSSIDVSDTEGFGWLDERGRGGWETWEGHLASVQEEEPEEKFYGKWHGLFETTTLERRRFEGFFRSMRRLLDGLEAPRRLVHGGFGYDNVLVHEGKVSAVLDWQDARFGDPLFDVAYLDFWDSGVDLVDLFEAHCGERGVLHEGYRTRIRCYKYYIGLDAMRFFAKTDNRDAYEGAVQILERLGG
jgi:hygromycin-B 4-O-kinase